MTTMIMDRITQDTSFPGLSVFPDLPVKAQESLAVLPVSPRARRVLLDAPLRSFQERPGTLGAPLHQASHLSPLPATPLSALTIAGERLPMFEAAGQRFTVAHLKRLAGLSRSARLLKVEASGRGTVLSDGDVVDLMENAELRVVRSTWAS